MPNVRSDRRDLRGELKARANRGGNPESEHPQARREKDGADDDYAGLNTSERDLERVVRQTADAFEYALEDALQGFA